MNRAHKVLRAPLVFNLFMYVWCDCFLFVLVNFFLHFLESLTPLSYFMPLQTLVLYYSTDHLRIVVASNSVSRFYFGHAIAPSHPNHMESWYDPEEKSNDVRITIDAIGGNKKSGQNGIQSKLLLPGKENFEAKHGGGSRKRHRNNALDESSLDDLAVRHGYTKINIALTTAPVASYCRGVCRLNFWLTTGNVGSYLDHPTKGKTLLVRRDISLNEAESVFQNPMHQIGREHRRTTN